MTRDLGRPKENSPLGYVPEPRCSTCEDAGWVYTTLYGDHVAPRRRQLGVDYVVRRCPACRPTEARA